MSLTTDEVIRAIRANPPERTASILILERVPFVFGDDWNVFRAWRESLSYGLGVDPCEIFVTGSAAVGVSLNPSKGLRAFGSHSDIDVAIVSSRHFDEAWHFMRKARRRDVSEQLWQLITDHREKYIYFGCIACDKLLAWFPFGSAWLEALDTASKSHPTEGRVISVRIYRDTSSLRGYQASNLRNIKALLS